MGKKRARNLMGIARFVKAMDHDPPKPSQGLSRPNTPRTTQSDESTAYLTVECTSDSPLKKRKLEAGQDNCIDEATGLIPRYTSINEVPQRLGKYFAQRHRYFSLYDEGCVLDEEGWYSVTPENIAHQIAERCRCDTILDAFCGVGGNAIAFAKTSHRVIALEISPVRLALARHNAKIYGVDDRIEFILTDYLDFARAYLSRPQEQRPIDAVFLSPPWGGPSYLTMSSQKEKGENDVLRYSDYSLQNLLPVPGDELFAISRQISHNIALFLPRNINLSEISELLKSETIKDERDLTSTQRIVQESVEVEEEYMGGKLKAVTCYFGGLVAGQEDMF